MDDIFKNLVSIFFTHIKFLFLKLVYTNKFRYSGLQRWSPFTEIWIGKNGNLVLGEKVRVHTGTRLRVRADAKVVIGNNIGFGYNCLITAHKYISIGDGCNIGPNVLFYDHDHDIVNYKLNDRKFKYDDVIIGKNVWIGANVVILRGTVIGDNCVVAAGTVLKGKYPPNTMIYSEKNIKLKEINFLENKN